MKKKFDLDGNVTILRMKKLFRVMKLTSLFLMISVVSVLASKTYSQTKTLNLNMNKTSVKEVLSEIENQSEFYFMYSRKLIDVDKEVSVNVKNQRIDQVLNSLFAGTDVSYTIKDRIIVLTTPEISEKEVLEAAQQKSVSGKVTDSDEQPLPGVTVAIKGTTQGTITADNGKFFLANVPDNAVLQFSFIGMKTQEVKVEEKTTINIKMEEETVGIEEVVAIGYGTTSRQNFTGSVSTMKVGDSQATLTSSPNILNMLQGIAPGVSIGKSGESGGDPTMLIRGQKSISSSSSNPLYVVDGIIFSGSINDIDVNSIEDVTILKDASTLSAYGSRAANGVLLITTKKGKRGKPVINFNSSLAFTTPDFRPEMRDANGYKNLMNRRSGLADDADPTWMGTLEKANYSAGKTTDWIDYVSRTGSIQNYTLSFSGASENSNYYLSAGHWDQKGNYYGDNYNRNTFTANVNTNINKYVEIGANTNLTFSGSDGTKPNYGAAVQLSPFGEPLLADGEMRKFPDGKEATTVNPLWNTFNGIDHESKQSTAVIGGYLNIKIPKVDGLSFKTTGSNTIRTSEIRHFTHETNFPDMNLGEEGYTTKVYDSHLIDANGYVSESTIKSWVWDNILTYYRTIKQHFVNATLVYTRDVPYDTDTKYISGSDFRTVGNTTLGIYGLTNAEVQKINTFSNTHAANIGYLGRLNYSYNNKYHLNAAVRHDGYSGFGRNKKWGTFPSIGGAWTISKENFMKSISQIDNLKLKLSWGKNGNQSLAPYGTMSPVSMGRGGNQVYYFDNTAGYAQLITGLGNPDLGWEETTSLNYGFEADFWKHRMHLDVNLYSSATKDQIFSRVIPVMTSGITTQNATMGQVNNKGIEINVSGLVMKKGNFTWNSSLIFTLNRNKLVELYGDGQNDITNNLFLGKSLGAIYGYVWDGIVKPGEENYVSNLVATPGDAKYADLNNDGQLTAADRKILGYSKENFRMGMTNTFAYKNFSIYMLVNGTFGGDGYSLAANNSAYLTDDTYFYHNTLNHPYWTPEKPSDKYPRWNFNDSRFMALQSYGFVRLQDMNFAYTFNDSMFSRYGINGLKIYLSGSNLFFYAPHWKGSDPEIRSFNAAQLQRTFTFGLNFKF